MKVNNGNKEYNLQKKTIENEKLQKVQNLKAKERMHN